MPSIVTCKIPQCHLLSSPLTPLSWWT
jgi:hypothetical protein